MGAVEARRPLRRFSPDSESVTASSRLRGGQMVLVRSSFAAHGKGDPALPHL